MRNRFAENFTLSTLKLFFMKNISKFLKYKKIRCLLQEIRTNLCERNRKVVYKYEGIWTCEGCIGKL
jgi:hypothetical protein